MGISLISAFNWYGFIIGSGLCLCLVLAYFVAKKRGYYKDIIFDIVIICIPITIVGLRLYYVIFDIIGNGNTWTFKEIIGIGQDGLRGLAIYGGLIGATLGAVIIHFWKRNKPPKDKVTLMQLLDLGFTFIILGQSIGRWGNFVNQEAYGPQVDFHFFPITVNINGSYHLATFFYESFWNIIGFAALYIIYTGKRQSFDGFVFSLYCIYYGIGRSWIEGLREDSLYGFMGLRVSQIFSIFLIIFGVCYIVYHLYKARSLGKKPFILVERSKLDNSYYGYEKSILHHPNDYTAKPKKQDYSDEFYSQADGGFADGGFADGGIEDVDDFYSTKEDTQDNSESNSENDKETTVADGNKSNTEIDDFYS